MRSAWITRAIGGALPLVIWLAGSLPAAAAPPGQVLVGRYFEKSRQADILIGSPGEDLSRLTKTPEFESSATFSPDGTEIAFVSQERDGNKVVAEHLMVMDADGTNVETLAQGAGTGVEWSPDGTQVAFVVLRDNGDSELVVVDRGTGEETILVSTYYVGHQLDWAPDGSRIVYSSFPEVGGNHDLYAVDVAGGEPVRLTDAEGSDAAPSFSPDGSKIVFSTTRDDPYDAEDGPRSSELYVMDADGGNETALTSTLATWDEDPQWSPDGNWIAYSRRFSADLFAGPTRDMDIFIIRPDGTDRRLVLKNRRVNERAPMWSPDSRWLGFNSDHDTRDTDAFVIRRSGRSLTRVTRYDGPDGLSDWR